MYADDLWMRDMQETVGVNSGFSQRFVDKARERAATVDGGLELSSTMRARDGEGWATHRTVITRITVTRADCTEDLCCDISP
jgi:hypothetical protein